MSISISKSESFGCDTCVAPPFASVGDAVSSWSDCTGVIASMAETIRGGVWEACREKCESGQFPACPWCVGSSIHGFAFCGNC
jgi:hypothetical protein